MGSYPHIHRAETAGRWFGAVVRRLMRGNGRVTRDGQPPVAVRIGLWAAGIVAIGLLILLAFWIAAVVAMAWIVLEVIQAGANAKPSRFELTDPHDHRQRLFYDPLFYNDDPDPRFEDK